MQRRMVLLVVALSGVLVDAQTASDSARVAQETHSEDVTTPDLLNREQLSAQDISRVLAASHAAMQDRSFSVTSLQAARGSGGRVEIQMGPAGRPRYVHAKGTWEETFEDYTGQTARACSGATLSQELVIDYVTVYDKQNPVDTAVLDNDGFVSDGAGGQIKVTSGVRDSLRSFEEAFEMYTNERPLSKGPKALIDGHTARALVAPHQQRPVDRDTSGPAIFSPDVEDWLWIDVESLFVVRWEIREAGISTNYGYVFSEQPKTRLRPPTLPTQLTVPTCVE